MADNLRKRGSPDSKTINMKEAWEKNYWKRKFRVSGQALAGAVRAIFPPGSQPAGLPSIFRCRKLSGG